MLIKKILSILYEELNRLIQISRLKRHLRWDYFLLQNVFFYCEGVVNDNRSYCRLTHLIVHNLCPNSKRNLFVQITKEKRNELSDENFYLHSLIYKAFFCLQCGRRLCDWGSQKDSNSLVNVCKSSLLFITSAEAHLISFFSNVIRFFFFFAYMWLEAVWVEHPVRLEITCEVLLVYLANPVFLLYCHFKMHERFYDVKSLLYIICVWNVRTGI